VGLAGISSLAEATIRLCHPKEETNGLRALS
jgi:hypothetical protein